MGISAAQLGRRQAILMYGYEAEQYPVIDLVEAFVSLAQDRANLGPMAGAEFSGLIHPVHHSGIVVAWELHAASAG